MIRCRFRILKVGPIWLCYEPVDESHQIDNAENRENPQINLQHQLPLIDGWVLNGEVVAALFVDMMISMVSLPVSKVFHDVGFVQDLWNPGGCRVHGMRAFLRLRCAPGS